MLEKEESHPRPCKILSIVLASSNVQGNISESSDAQANAFITRQIDPGEISVTVRSVEEFWVSIVRCPPETDPK